jgi:type VI secretion system protein ImpF
MNNVDRRPDSKRADIHRKSAPRVQLPLLDRLIDDAPDHLEDPPLSAADGMDRLRAAVRRDMEALLNARRPWRPVPDHYPALLTSPLTYGIPDVMAATLADPRRRDGLRAQIEDAIRRFEPRFAAVRVILLDNEDKLEPTLHLRIEALLRAEPAPEPVAFDTVVEAATAQATVRARDDV